MIIKSNILFKIVLITIALQLISCKKDKPPMGEYTGTFNGYYYTSPEYANAYNITHELLIVSVDKNNIIPTSSFLLQIQKTNILTSYYAK